MELIKLLQSNVPLSTTYLMYACLVFADVMSGMLKAWKNGRFKSRTLRDGMFASIGELFVLILCIFFANLMPLAIVEGVVFAILTFMIVKEISSILENLVATGVRLPNWLVKGLQVYTEKLDSDSKEV